MSAGQQQSSRILGHLAIGLGAGVGTSVWQYLGPLDYVGLIKFVPVAAVNLTVGGIAALLAWILTRHRGRVGQTAAVIAALALTALWGYVNVRRTPDVLLYISDAVNVDHLSVYGYGRETTPALEAVAEHEEGVLFSQAVAQASYTWGGTPAILASAYPTMLGLFRFTQGLSEEVVTLAEALGEADYSTLGLAANPHLTRPKGFAQGFEQYEDSMSWSRAFDAREATELFTQLDQSSDDDQPQFALIFVVDCHTGMYPASKEDAKAFRPEVDLTLGRWDIDEAKQYTEKQRRDFIAYYDASIRYVDDAFGRLVSYLREQDRLDSTLLVFTADHGESFWAHNHIGHGQNLYEPVIRIPLLMRFPSPVLFPRIYPIAEAYRHQVRQVDLMPTILELVGTDGRIPAMRGKSLLPYLYGRTKEQPNEGVLSEHYGASSTRRSWRTSRWKYIAYYRLSDEGEQLLREELFDLVADPDELLNLASEEEDVVADLRTAMQAEVLAMQPYILRPTTTELTDEQRRRLEAMGYLK